MATNDPFDTGYDLPKYENKYYGKCEVVPRFVVWEKGEPPRDFLPTDMEGDKQTEFAFSVTTIDAQGLTRPVMERKVYSRSPAWNKITYPSIEEIGTTLRELNGSYVLSELVPTGRKYTNKTTGKEVNETTLKFVKVYESESACIRDYEDAAGMSHEASSAADDAATTVAKALIATANGDLKKLAINLKAAGSPYTVDSEFIVNLLKETAVAA